MAQRHLQILSRFQRTVRDCRRFADDARRWSLPGASPHITEKRRDSIIELAFLRGFLGWESFLEESFILHMLGRRPRHGVRPHRYALPPDRAAALDFSSAGKDYAKWDGAPEVVRRAKQFFRDGVPYVAPLQSKMNALQDAKTVRNAVAHRSGTAIDQFEKLARNELKGALPPGLTVGGFLNTTKPGSAPPESFLDFYLGALQLVAEKIIRP